MAISPPCLPRDLQTAAPQFAQEILLQRIRLLETKGWCDRLLASHFKVGAILRGYRMGWVERLIRQLCVSAVASKEAQSPSFGEERLVFLPLFSRICGVSLMVHEECVDAMERRSGQRAVESMYSSVPWE